MNKNDLLSVIVPVYNVEKYIIRCIDSILSQSYENFEIVVVDDGSTDSSIVKMNKYGFDSRVKIISQKNQGLAGALNTGLMNINQKTKFIGFVDSDDYIDKDFYSILIAELVSSDADICVCNLGINNSKVLWWKDYWKMMPSNQLWVVSRCNKVYRKSFFTNYLFPIGKVGEDLYHSISLFRNIVFCCLNYNGYHYTYNPNSISKNHTESDWKDIIEGWLLLLDFFKEMYGKCSLSQYPLKHVIEYYHQYKKSYSNKDSIREQKKYYKTIKSKIFFRGLKFRGKMSYLKFIILGWHHE